MEESDGEKDLKFRNHLVLYRFFRKCKKNEGVETNKYENLENLTKKERTFSPKCAKRQPKGTGTSDVPTGIEHAKQPSDVLFFTIFSLWDACVLIGCRFYDVGCWGVGGWKGGTVRNQVWSLRGSAL